MPGGWEGALARVITAIDTYYYQRLRVLARTERVGPLTLFVAADPDRHFALAYPTPGAGGFTADDVHQVLVRQSELGEPGTLAWVHEQAAGLAGLTRRVGLATAGCPLLAWTHPLPPQPAPPPGYRVRALNPGDRRVERACALIAAATPGAPVASGDPRPGGTLVEQVRARGTVLVAALDPGGRPVAAAAHTPCQGVTELTGIGSATPHDPQVAAAVAAATTRDALARELTPFTPGHTPVPYQQVGYTRAGTWFTATTRTGPPRRPHPATARETTHRAGTTRGQPTRPCGSRPGPV